MTTEWYVAVKVNGAELYMTEEADIRRMTKDRAKAHVFTTKPIADAVANMMNGLVMDAVLSGNVVPNVRFRVYANN